MQRIVNNRSLDTGGDVGELSPKGKISVSAVCVGLGVGDWGLGLGFRGLSRVADLCSREDSIMAA